MTDNNEIQQALEKCERKFLTLFRESPLVLTITSAKDYRYIEVNHTFERMTGWHHDEIIGRTPFDIGIWVNRNERVDMVKRLLSEGGVQHVEVCARMKNGEIRTGPASAALIEINDETCVLTLILDTTDIKGAEEARRVAERLSRVVRSLLRAHEEEHGDIVRELHNYIDSLALVSIGLGHLQQNPSSSAAEVKRRIAEAKQQVEDLLGDIQNLSHQLRSPKLEYVGIEAATASFCRDLSDQKQIQIDFASETVPKELPHQVCLVLFHVLQEAVQNAAAHSGSQRVQVLLNGGANQLALTVRDWGSGFISEEALRGSGIGLTVMQERLKIVNGELSIESQPQRGTTIHVRVPLMQQANTATTG